MSSDGPLAPANTKVLRDDCFLHDKDRLKHAEALDILRDRLSPIAGTEICPIDQALERVAAHPAVAPSHVPAADNAAVDGYAFAHASYVAQDGRLPVTMRLQAGDRPQGPLPMGEAARIFTGAIMPGGADSIAMQEDCSVEDGDPPVVAIPPGLKPGANRRRAGEDLKAGTHVVVAGRRLTAPDLAALASIGFEDICVHTPLRIAVFSSGNELATPGGSKSKEQVFDANRPMLKALLSTLPVSVTDLGVLEDTEAAFEQALVDAAERHDVLITTGGASRGEADHLISTLDRIGTRQLWQLAIKPGRPMCMGQIGGGRFAGSGAPVPVFGLPGNPVAAFVAFLLYVRPSLLRLGGSDWVIPTRYPLPATFEIARKKPDRREFLRGTLVQTNQGLAVAKFPRDGSGLITGLREADGLIEIPEHITELPQGTLCRFHPVRIIRIVGADPATQLSAQEGHQEAMAKVAFIGLGVMGYPMAMYLATKGGHDVTVYNRTTAKAEKWVQEHGGQMAPTPSEAAAGADFVFACVGNDDDLRSVTIGETGAFQTMQPGSIFIDNTTASSQVALELHADAKARGIGFIDAPVSGGQAGAENGILTVMCGGDEADYAKAEPVIENFARSVRRIGGPGCRAAVQDGQPDHDCRACAGPRRRSPLRASQRTRCANGL
jgi:molybdopterin molybdotransferase